MIIAVLLGIAAMLGFLGVQGQRNLVIGAVVGAVLLMLMLMRPRLATAVVLFGLYMNLPVVAMRYHDVSPMTATAFPLLLIIPLASYMVFRREKIVLDKTFVWMFLYLAVQCVSALFAYNINYATDAVLQYLVEGILLYFLMVNVIRSETDLRLATWALVIAAAIMAGIVVYQEVTHTFDNNYGGLAQRLASFEIGDTQNWRDRAGGSVGEPNFFAQVLLAVVPLTLFPFWSERSWLKRILAVALTVVLIGGIVVTFSRGASIGLMIMLLVMAYLWRVKPIQIVLGIVGVILVISMVAPEYFLRVASIADVQGLVDDTGARDRSIRGRANENIAAIQMFLDHMLLGVGPGNYRALYLEYTQDIGLYVRFRERPAHNLYLSTAAELGIIGLATFLALVGVQIQSLLKFRKEYRDKREEIMYMATALAIGLIAYLVAGLFLHLAYQRYFWILIALASATARIGAAKFHDEAEQHPITTS